MINKDVRKSLAHKNGDENPIWSWNDSGMMVSEQYNQLMDAILYLMIGNLDREKTKKNDTAIKVEIKDVDEDETESDPNILMFYGFNDEDKIPSDEKKWASKQVKKRTELY